MIKICALSLRNFQDAGRTVIKTEKTYLQHICFPNCGKCLVSFRDNKREDVQILFSPNASFRVKDYIVFGEKLTSINQTFILSHFASCLNDREKLLLLQSNFFDRNIFNKILNV